MAILVLQSSNCQSEEECYCTDEEHCYSYVQEIHLNNCWFTNRNVSNYRLRLTASNAAAASTSVVYDASISVSLCLVFICPSVLQFISATAGLTSVAVSSSFHSLLRLKIINSFSTQCMVTLFFFCEYDFCIMQWLLIRFADP